MAQIQNGYGKVDGLGSCGEVIKEIFEKIDTDKSGAIDYSEFIAASIDRKKMLSKKRLERIFKMFDKDCSGTISKDEIKQMLGGNKGDQEIDDRVWEELMLQADADGNGEVGLHLAFTSPFLD